MPRSRRKKFRKIPVVVEAIQYDGSSDSIEDAMDFIYEGHGTREVSGNLHGGRIYFRLLDEPLSMDVGEWVIKDIDGEFRVCPPDIFAQSHDEVDPATSVLEAEQRVLDTADKVAGAQRDWEESLEELVSAKGTNVKANTKRVDTKAEHKRAQQDLAFALTLARKED